eukprot:TRINITY_DN2972_c0_g1_i1.p1 TRINITY_DN2972_c0_g1~~TRINITY_DN2972_c0_g1_i1.p1  ORF type:complete len:359 (-),score=114.31 TRINITY_DN2972_c0_g1_i1:416-1492(-)
MGAPEENAAERGNTGAEATAPSSNGAFDLQEVASNLPASSPATEAAPASAPRAGGVGPPGFDFSQMGDLLKDPEITRMAEQFASDPSFAQITQRLQGMVQPGAPGQMPAIDQQQYMATMTDMMKNPNFLAMAENLGTKLMQDPQMAAMMQQFQDPSYAQKMQARLQEARNDPSLRAVLDELETGGPAAMMKYWNNQEVLSKIGKVVSEGGQPGQAPRAATAAPTTEEEEEEEVEEEAIHVAASEGDLEALQQLLKDGADTDVVDAEKRTALHFACGHGKEKIVEALVKAGANIDALDKNQNTPLHYAAGYGRKDCVKALMDGGASVTKRNLDGKTAIEVATLNKQTEVVKMLEEDAFL